LHLEGLDTALRDKFSVADHYIIEVWEVDVLWVNSCCWYGMVRNIVQWDCCQRERGVQLNKIDNRLYFPIILFEIILSRITWKGVQSLCNIRLVVAKINRCTSAVLQDLSCRYPVAAFPFLFSFLSQKQRQTKLNHFSQSSNYILKLVQTTNSFWVLHFLSILWEPRQLCGVQCILRLKGRRWLEGFVSKTLSHPSSKLNKLHRLYLNSTPLYVLSYLPKSPCYTLPVNAEAFTEKPSQGFWRYFRLRSLEHSLHV